ncbi:MAG: zf-HC2 domain-containing protein [Nitrospirota bacterium]
MTHNDIRHKLSEYIDGSITTAERNAIDEHLRTCTECSDALTELRKTIEHIREVEEVEAPAWMTQKVMAKVREEKEAKKSLRQQVYSIFTMQYPIQVVTVLFLAVTAYYIYQGIDPSRKYTEEPVGTLAKKDTPVAVRPEHREGETMLEAAPKPKQTPREPGYKSLDMKYAYEKPAPPVPQEQQPASSPAPAKQEAPALAGDEAARKKPAAAPKTTAPSMMAEQSASTAGAGRQFPAAEAPLLKEQKKQSFLADDRDDREADNLLDVTEHFVKYDLPDHMKKQGLRYSTRKFVMDLPDLRWMQETAAFRSAPCSLRYVVDVEFSGQSSKYLYCFDQSRIRLLGIYELQQNTWSEKRP